MKVKASIKSGLIILRGKSFRSKYPFTFIYSQNILYKVSYVSKGRLKSFIVSPLSKGQQRIPTPPLFISIDELIDFCVFPGQRQNENVLASWGED